MDFCSRLYCVAIFLFHCKEHFFHYSGVENNIMPKVVLRFALVAYMRGTQVEKLSFHSGIRDYINIHKKKSIVNVHSWRGNWMG